MEENNIKLWGLVNIFSDTEGIEVAKGGFNIIHTVKYGKVVTIQEGSIFKDVGNRNWYFRDLSKPVEQFGSLEIKAPTNTWLMYYKHSGQYYPMYSKLWTVMAVRILNDLEFFDYVYHN